VHAAAAQALRGVPLLLMAAAAAVLRSSQMSRGSRRSDEASSSFKARHRFRSFLTDLHMLSFRNNLC
jgi:hypothetical protein